MKHINFFHKSICTALSCVMLLGSTVSMAHTQSTEKKPDTIMGVSTLYDYEPSPYRSPEYLAFGTPTGDGSQNSWSKENDYKIYQGLVKDTLDADGNIQLSTVKIKGKEVPLTVPGLKNNSGKLFQEGEKTGTYKMPFLYNPENGRYEFDSKKNNLTANPETGILEYTKPNSIGFMPMGLDNFYFGNVTTLPFVYANGGKVDGKDMVFEFTGDDDVWVFLDGRLALDLGGIHNAVKGTINFATGEIQTTAKIKAGDSNNTVTTTYLKDIGFDTSVRDHEVKIFYLERGAGFANCKMSFNLIQPTNYVVNYYDGKYYDGKNSDTGRIATVIQTSREDGTQLYPGDAIRQKEIKINVNDKTAELSNREDYYGGFVVDDNFIRITDPQAVVTTVTEDDSDVVNVVFLPKPSYTVTYWTTAAGADPADSSKWSQITQKVYSGSIGQKVTKDDIVTEVKFDGQYYGAGVIVTPAEDHILGTLNPDAPFNVDVVVVPAAEPAPTPTPTAAPDYKPYPLSNEYAYIFGRSDELMEPNDGVARGEAAAMLYRLLKQNDRLGGFNYDKNAAPLFSDLNGRWDRSALEYMAYLGLYNTARETISPDARITRAEAFQLFCVALGFTQDTTLTAEQYAKILTDAGYVEGYGDGSGLGLDKLLTRAQYCKIYNMITGRDQYHLETYFGKKVLPETYGFTDIPDDWTHDVVLKATSAFDENGYVVIENRGIRNVLDDYT